MGGGDLDRGPPLILAALVALILLVTLLPQDPGPSAPEDQTPSAPGFPSGDAEARVPDPHGALSYGMDVYALEALEEVDVPPDYATIWIGPWNLEDGWGEPKRQIAAMKEAGVVPAIHFYYWGDDMTRTCFEDGCWSSLHHVQKDQASWHALADAFFIEFNETLDEWPVMILLETEFNKADVDGYEPLDAALSGMADRLRTNLSNASVILPFGNWNREGWTTWDRAANRSDYIGIQSMRASTKDSMAHYTSAYDEIRDGALQARSLFDKPVVIHDLALSSYPEPDYREPQRRVVEEVFGHLDELKEIGVESLTYRAWHDDPQKPLSNYYGVAERHWGLSTADGEPKPAAEVWVEGVRADRLAALDAT